MSLDGDEVNEMWHVHADQCHSAIRRNKMLVHATTRVSPANTLNERRQSPADTYCMPLFILNTPRRRVHRDRKSIIGHLIYWEDGADGGVGQ